MNKPIWKSSWLDWLLTANSIVFSIVAAISNHELLAVIMAFCAGNQFQICLISSRWNALRELRSVSKNRTIEVFEREMNEE